MPPNAKPPDVPPALAKALQLHQQGRLAEAERLYAEVLAGEGGPDPTTLLNHGRVLNALGRRQEALQRFDQAIALQPTLAAAYISRGAALAALGRIDDALAGYRRALEIAPDRPEAHFAMGNLLNALGRGAEALASFDRAVALRPDYAQAHGNRGIVLAVLDRKEEALASYDRALALNPRYAEAFNNRSGVLRSLNRYDEALADLDRAVALDRNYAGALYNRGRVLSKLNRASEAAASHRQAVAARPAHVEARFAACFAELPIVYEDETEVVHQRAAFERGLRELVADADATKVQGNLLSAIAVNQPFHLAYQGHDDRELRGLYGALSSRIAANTFPPASLAAPPAPEEPVRIGIVSAYFYLHSNWKMPIKGWLSQLDRNRFQVFGYHVGGVRDAETEVAAGFCHKFVDRQLTVANWRDAILADAPHVLIYPGLAMEHVSCVLAAQRLAPMQCVSWGHPETSGLPTIDYFLSSDLMEPPDVDVHYTEKLVRLPNLSIYCEPGTAGSQVTRVELGLRTDAVAFWCGQSLYKYLPQYDSVFACIAKELRSSQFVFIRHPEAARITEIFEERLDRAFAAIGLRAQDHCVFLPRLKLDAYVAAMGGCDVFLDSIGWSGCNSTMESLVHDLPIVTMPGALMRGRHSAAILQMMDVTETVAQTLDDYVSIAVSLGADPVRRHAVSRKIAANKHRVYSDRACIAALEDFLERAARRPTGTAS